MLVEEVVSFNLTQALQKNTLLQMVLLKLCCECKSVAKKKITAKNVVQVLLPHPRPRSPFEDAIRNLLLSHF